MRAEEQAHKHSRNNKKEIENSDLCGCFYCCNTFEPDEITTWADSGKTALCPRCGIDSVLGSAAGYPLNDGLLGRMRLCWFSAPE